MWFGGKPYSKRVRIRVGVRRTDSGMYHICARKPLLLIELVASWFRAVTDVPDPRLFVKHNAHILRTILRTTCYFRRLRSLSGGDVGAVFINRFGTRATARPPRKFYALGSKAPYVCASLGPHLFAAVSKSSGMPSPVTSAHVTSEGFLLLEELPIGSSTPHWRPPSDTDAWWYRSVGVKNH